MSRASLDWLAATFRSTTKVDPQRSISMVRSGSVARSRRAILAGTGTYSMSARSPCRGLALTQSLAHFLFPMGLAVRLPGGRNGAASRQQCRRTESDREFGHHGSPPRSPNLSLRMLRKRVKALIVCRRRNISWRCLVWSGSAHVSLRSSRCEALRKSCGPCPGDLLDPAVRAPASFAENIVPHAVEIRIFPGRELLAAKPMGLSGRLVGGVDSLALLRAVFERWLAHARARATALEKPAASSARESYAAFVADPWPRVTGLEAQVAALCEAAWEEFRKIEAEGGLFASLAEGRVQERVLKSRADKASRRAAIANGPSLPAGLYQASVPESEREAVVACEPLLPALIEQYEAPSVEAETGATVG